MYGAGDGLAVVMVPLLPPLAAGPEPVPVPVAPMAPAILLLLVLAAAAGEYPYETDDPPAAPEVVEMLAGPGAVEMLAEGIVAFWA